MGIVLGRVTVETAQYEVLRQTKDYEIRKYAPCVVAEVQASELYEAGERWSPSQFNTDAFRLLARYIGVFGKPSNVAAVSGGSESVAMTAPVTSTPEPMAMTAPVTSAPEQVAMTAPVQSAPTSARQGESLAFVLPRKYQKVEQAPRPTDDHVHLRQVPSRLIATMVFSGSTDLQRCVPVAKRFFERLAAESLPMAGQPKALDEARWMLARYNPPWTIPWMKRNEILIELDGDAEVAPPQPGTQ
ncbi:hypothetical protein CDCA_CDCA18G4520 [Cyanidium caldarium]|uniref:SOUL heme-binding protein n=1 Tax=Cyanidium caldarium TaxID=2771 RepID=A0AAV9J2B6_CYACA|nr:hypothetical protein CDCA_CDCA18G4520 [Cyanidium caldarium]